MKIKLKLKEVLNTSLICWIFCNNLYAEDIYVDNQIKYGIIHKKYSIKNRNNTGNDGNAYNSIQKAINLVRKGDTIYIRGGTYYEHLNIPDGKQGSDREPITLRSYPGEWAIIDGENKDHAVIRYKDGSHNVCPKYWIFRNLEITGGGIGNTKNGSGGGIMLDTAAHITFKYLYIHDNSGGGGWNDAGIAIKNEVQGAQFITIKYCYLKNNSCNDNSNCANISLFADYIDTPSKVKIKNARKGNEIAFNYIVGSNKGIKSKAEQYLSLSNDGFHKKYSTNGDKIHHNIVKDFYGDGIECRQDFIQVYNNIVTSSNATSTTSGIVLGCQDWNADREPFYAVAYNNLLIGVDLCLEHQKNDVYSPPLNPNCYIFNNIFENVGPEHYDGRNDLNIFFTYNLYGESDINMDTVHVECNLFTPRKSNEEIINLADDQNYDKSAKQWLAAGYSKKIYTTKNLSKLHKAGSRYKCYGNYEIEQGINISNGGIGGKHPYLRNINIPAYIGAADPKDDLWIDGVIKLTNINELIKSLSSDPEWAQIDG